MNCKNYKGEQITFSGTASNPIHHVKIFVDGYLLTNNGYGNPITVSNNTYSLDYSFYSNGMGRELKVVAYNQSNEVIDEIYRTINVLNASVNFTLNVPTNITKGQEITFSGSASYPISKVKLFVDGYQLIYNNIGNPINVSNNTYSPVADYPSSNWVRITDKDELVPGDVLSTHQGHAWGATWHGGLYYGKENGVHYVLDNSKRGNLNGTYVRTWYYKFYYYYKPVHDKLTAQY